MQYLLTLAEYRNFTKASKALYISQPSLSSYVAKIEDVLGMPLFDRSTTPLTMTYAGEVYVKGAREVLDACSRLEKQLSDISAQKIGRIRVALSDDRAAYMLPMVLPKYQQIHPNVTVQVESSASDQVTDLLLDNKIDIAILPDSEWNSQQFIQNDIYSEEMVLVANQELIHEEHLIEGVRGVVDISRLEEVPLITLHPQHSFRSYVNHLFSSNGLHPNVFIETSSLAAAYRLATTGLGAAIVPRMTLELTKETKKTPVYSLGACGTTRKIVAVQRKDHDTSRIEKDFITVSRQAFMSR